jgi:hypothetical protein
MKTQFSLALATLALSTNALALPQFFACSGMDQEQNERSFSVQFSPTGAHVETDEDSSYDLSAQERENERALKFAMYADYDYDGYGGYIKFSLPWKIKEPETTVTQPFPAYLTEAIYSEIGLVSKTDIKATCKPTTTPAEFAKLAKLAESFETIMEGIQYASEADYGWEAWYTSQTVSEKYFNENAYALKRVMLAGGAEMQNWGKKDVNEFFSDMAESTDPKEVAAYKKFKTALFKTFKNVRMLKVGKPDSGALELYILGITKEGHLVGFTVDPVV